MNQKYEKYLPIGSIVLLNDATKRLMITGFCIVPKENPKKMYDYCGCLYPEGVLNSNMTCLFNHDQIEKVYHMGLIDEEEKEFKTKLGEIVKFYNKNLTN